MVDISSVAVVLVPKRSALETVRRERSEDVSFGIGTLLVVEQSSLENRPKGVLIYTVVHGTLMNAVSRADSLQVTLKTNHKDEDSSLW